MIVERIWTANAYRNFNYLIACPETGEALAIDPLDIKSVWPQPRPRAGRSRRFLTPMSITTTPAATQLWWPPQAPK